MAETLQSRTFKGTFDNIADDFIFIPADMPVGMTMDDIHKDYMKLMVLICTATILANVANIVMIVLNYLK